MKERVRFTEGYMVHFESESQNIMVGFRVYEVVYSKYLGGPKKGKETISYVIDSAQDHIDEDEINENDLPMATMQGSVCWRGVWEGRIYFDHEEYWSEDLKKLSELFSTHIEPWCKNYIRKFYPHADP